MPYLDATALTDDPDGTEFLRAVLDTGEPAVVPPLSAFSPSPVTRPGVSTSAERPTARVVFAVAEAA